MKSPAQRDAMDIDQSRLTRLLGYNLTRANVRLLGAFHQHMRAVSLRPVEFSALVLIASNPSLHQKQLGAALDVSPPNLAVVLDRLEARRLVTRTRNPTDRRAQRLALTALGETTVRQAEHLAGAMEEDVLAMLSNGERAILMELLQKLAVAALGT